jgi:hypothetical protein
MSSFFTSAWFWVGLGLLWLLSVLASHSWGIHRGIRAYGHHHQKSLLKFLDRWVKVNDQFVSDLAHAALDDNATAQQKNVHLVADNRRLKKKAVRLAVRYGAAARELRVKPYLDLASRMAFYMDTLARTKP